MIQKTQKTLDKGKDFEETVYKLLQLQGWRIEKEQLIGHKKVDAYAERFGYFRELIRIVVECKNYEKRLSQRELTNIYANYLPLTDKIDQILLVTRLEITPSAKTYVKKAKKMLHMTYLDLMNSLLNFSSYIQGLISHYLASSVCKYYVKQFCESLSADTFTNSGYAEDVVLDWIDSDEKFPLAITSGYGMGKTTLLKRIAFVLAEKHNDDPTSRIPILIDLNEISTEQSLEGLLGKHFTTKTSVFGYNFDIFMELNRMGRFVVLLDGFDEMQCTISIDTMRFNFRQLNRLIIGNSKVLISGRPTVFLNSEESMEILHGTRTIQNQAKLLPDQPNYQIIRLLPFTSKQIISFIKSYTNYLQKVEYSLYNSERTIEKANDVINSISSNEKLYSLVSRPVQLKMLLTILPAYDSELDSITLTILYADFLDLLMRREIEKQARSTYSIDERYSFSCDLAFWMWKNNNQKFQRFTDIPDYLFSSFIRSDEPLDCIKRELLASCFIESKRFGSYFYPHRSIQEFLVAEKLKKLIEQNDIQFDQDIYITKEITHFFSDIIDEKIYNSIMQKICKYRGMIGNWLIELLLPCIKDPNEILKKKWTMKSPWSRVILVEGFINHQWGRPNDQIISFSEEFLEKPLKQYSLNKDWNNLRLILQLILRSYLGEHMRYKDFSNSNLWEGSSIRELYFNATQQFNLTHYSKPINRTVIIDNILPKEFCCLRSWLHSNNRLYIEWNKFFGNIF
jgi:hypothetical protein